MRQFLKQDFVAIESWMAKRKQPCPPYQFLPPLGLIIDYIACGFLIKCDNGFGILDFYMSNPDVPLKARGEAIDKITSTLIGIAKRDNLKVLKCDTEKPSIYRLAMKHEFKSVGNYISMVREL